MTSQEKWHRDLRITAVIMFTIIALFWTYQAFAQDAQHTVTIEWGDTVAKIIDALTAIIVALAVAAWGYVATQLPGWTKPIVYTLRVEQLLTRAVQSALARAKQDVVGKEITATVSEPIIADAINYVFKNGADDVLQWMGTDLPPLIEKILARLKDQHVTVPNADPNALADSVFNQLNTAPQAAKKRRRRKGAG